MLADRQERQRDDLGRREEGPQGHLDRRAAAEVEVVHRADDPADRVQDGVEVDDPHGHPLRHHAEQHDQERHHDESVWAAKG